MHLIIASKEFILSYALKKEANSLFTSIGIPSCSEVIYFFSAFFFGSCRSKGGSVQNKTHGEAYATFF